MLVTHTKEYLNLPYSILFKYARHAKPSNIILIRHAQSVFNAMCHKYPIDQIYSKKAEEEFHHDPDIIDCQITQSARKNLQPQKIRNSFKNKSAQNTIFFVSPMLRTLQTAQMILDVLNSSYDVKVLPQLSQVLSKICDFSSGFNDKKQQFETFDFRYLDEWVLENNLCEFSQNWQDPFVDGQIRNKVDPERTAGRRYLKVLKERFPRPLENAQNCKNRSVEGYKKALEIARLKSYKNIVIVSHNRVLKNIESHIKGIKVEDYDNLQIRKIKIAELPQSLNNRATHMESDQNKS